MLPFISQRHKDVSELTGTELLSRLDFTLLLVSYDYRWCIEHRRPKLRGPKSTILGLIAPKLPFTMWPGQGLGPYNSPEQSN